MFDFVVRYLGVLKHIPLFAQFFDAFLKLTTLLSNPNVLDYIDDIEKEVATWPDVSLSLHKLGGVQFNFNEKEIGHIHGNGTVDILLTRKLKSELLMGGKVKDHHTIKNSGWITFHILTNNDREFTVHLLRSSMELRR